MHSHTLDDWQHESIVFLGGAHERKWERRAPGWWPA